ncbi:MAG: ATP-dependent helicase HrpB [Candidatus Endobugula sp.]
MDNLVPHSLPIHTFLNDIQQSLGKQKNLVLQAEPGAGKSTAVPLYLLDAPWLATDTGTKAKKIIMLEPRRVAAKSIAHYLASQLGEKVGERIGYHVKNDRKISPHTQLEIVTEGILTRRLQHDPELSDIGLIIFDEFHERSLQADIGLMLALEVQQTLRDDLKLLVMSATIDTSFIADYLDGAAVIECPGRAFPVSVDYQESRPSHRSGHSSANLCDQVMATLQAPLDEQDQADTSQGDVLVFLPGQADIMRCVNAAEQRWGKQTESQLPSPLFLPLFGGLSLAQQEQAIQPDPNGRRRVIFTTNIAETSLTINGVVWVIDSGLEKRLQYDPSSGMSRLATVAISKASAEQRKGRAGRVQEGHCIRLWTKSKQATLIDYQPEEILSSELASTVLELYAWGQTDYHSTPWLTAPPLGHYQTAANLLTALGLIELGIDDKNKSNKTLSPIGKQAVHLGVHPRLAAMLLSCGSTAEKSIACDLAALLNEQDIIGQQQNIGSNVDIGQRFMALQDCNVSNKNDKQNAIKRYGIKRNLLEQVTTLSRGLYNKLHDSGDKKIKKTLRQPTLLCDQLSDWQSHISALLLHAYPDRLAKRRSNSNRYIMANGKGVVLADDDALCGSEWLIVSDCDGQKREGRIYAACAIEHSQVIALLSEKLIITKTYSLDNKKQKIVGRKHLRYEAITVSETALADIPQEAFIECLRDLLKNEGLSLLNWTARCVQWLERVQWLAAYTNDFPNLSREHLQNNATDWLLPYLSHISSLAQLKTTNIFDLLNANLSWQQQQALDAEAPTSYTSPSGKTVDIIYDKNQGPTVPIVLQEMFGQLSSPVLAYNQVPLRFELLSPARRPIQTTSDLANFWVSSYFDVAKDMRAKYPRHRWPEEPLLATPGHSRKPRK